MYYFYRSRTSQPTPVLSSDEFADVKAVKLLRRGRRLQQVEYAPSFTTLIGH
jgi:hypothetical protein